jgi:hypothetical protein
MSFEGAFIINCAKTKKTIKIEQKAIKAAKRVIKYNAIEQKFNEIINNTTYRLRLIEDEKLSRNYLKFTKEGRLVTIPKTSWSNILVKLLNDKFYKETIVQVLGKENIRVSEVERSAMFNKFNSPSERFGSVYIHKVSLVQGSGNYHNQALNEYQVEVNRINSLATVKPIIEKNFTDTIPLYNIYHQDPNNKWY